MKVRSLIVPALLMAAVPAWAHCGKCGVGGKKDGHAGHDHAAHAQADAHAELGSPAPDFTLTALDGKEYKLSELKGKVVVLEWINHECPVVNRYHDANATMEVFAKFKDKPVVWLAIDSSHFCQDKADSIRTWVKRQKIDYPILLDAPGKVGHTFGAKTTPHFFVIDAKGTLAYAGSFDDDRYGKNESKRLYVQEAVSALLQGSAVPMASTKPFGCGVKYKK